MSTTCWAADVGDGLAPAEMMMVPAKAKPRGDDPIECCVRPGYFRGSRDYACKHRDGCLHGLAEKHRPPEWDPPRKAFLLADGRDPKVRLGRVKPLIGPDTIRKPGPRSRLELGKPAKGKRRKSR